MKKVILVLALYISGVSYGQTINKSVLFADNFDYGNPEWSQPTVSNNGYEAYFNQGKYICRLPENNEMGWGWTFIGLPSSIKQAVDNNSRMDLEFDWSVLSNRSNSRIGLMFDTYNIVPGSCPGGDFRAILFQGDGNTMYSSFVQTENCNSQYKWKLDGTAVSERQTNHVKISKDNYTWQIFINDVKVMDFNYKGSMMLTRLNYGRGTYAFDNFKITKKELSSIPNFAPAPPGNNPKIWVLLVGINNYVYQKPLNYTVNDVRAMYNFWTSTSGGRIPREQIILLENESATVNNILQKANALFSKASKDDIIITFLSGHGGYGSFASYDGTLDYQDLNAIINRSDAQRKMCIIDACHSGSFADKDVYTSKGRILNEDEASELLYSSLRRSGAGITYLLACRANQVSIESGELRHGLFTYYMLEGLKGRADANDDNLITVGELYNYIGAKIPEYNSRQNPELKGTHDPQMPLAVIHN